MLSLSFVFYLLSFVFCLLSFVFVFCHCLFSFLCVFCQSASFDQRVLLRCALLTRAALTLSPLMVGHHWWGTKRMQRGWKLKGNGWSWRIYSKAVTNIWINAVLTLKIIQIRLFISINLISISFFPKTKGSIIGVFSSGKIPSCAYTNMF